MLAKTLRLAIYFTFFWAMAASAFFASLSWWLAVLIGLAVMFFYAWVLVLGFALTHWINRDDAATRAHIGQLARAWWGEIISCGRVFLWWQAFRERAIPDYLPITDPPRRGVVLIHGFICNRAFWTPYMRQLQAQGIPFVALSLEPVFASINRYRPTVEQAVQRLNQHTGLAPNLVGHSMGGLVARAWIQTRADVDAFHRLITIGSPHHGTALSLFSPFANAQQMQRGHEWHQLLGARETPAIRARFTCWYSHCDNIVLPASTATLIGADNRFVPARGHVDMAFDPTVMAGTFALLRDD